MCELCVELIYNFYVNEHSFSFACIYFLFHMYSDKIKRCFVKLCCYLSRIDTIDTFIS